jgi:hypothetical protein
MPDLKNSPVLAGFIYALTALGVLVIIWLTIVVSAATWHFMTH